MQPRSTPAFTLAGPLVALAGPVDYSFIYAAAAATEKRKMLAA